MSVHDVHDIPASLIGMVFSGNHSGAEAVKQINTLADLLFNYRWCNVVTYNHNNYYSIQQDLASKIKLQYETMSPYDNG